MELLLNIVSVLSVVLLRSSADIVPCQFNANCSCDSTTGYATCANFTTWPVFQKVSHGPSSITVTGTYESIPANAFYNLTSIYTINLIRDEQAPLLPLTVDDNALLMPPQPASALWIHFVGFKGMDQMPKQALINAQRKSVMLFINYCSFPTLGSNMFAGIPAIQLNLDHNGITTIEPNAFNGTSSAYGALNISLVGNNITEMPVFNNGFMESVDLSYNKIVRLYNQPGQGDSASPFVSLTHNQIRFVGMGSFEKLELLHNLDLSYNPVEMIELGAFMTAQLYELTLNNLPNLTNVDMLMTFGMRTVSVVTLSNCTNLKAISIDDVTQMPPSLKQIRVGPGTDLQFVGAEFQDWLGSSNATLLDVSDNYNFRCDQEIKWMANFVFCTTPLQMVVDNSYCAGSNNSLTLSSYLHQLQPTC